MKALVYEDVETLGFRDMPKAEAGEGEHLIRVVASGICGSDMHAYHEEGINADQLYDDDVGGPLYAAGHEGVVLKPLDEDGKRKARDFADRMFLEIQQPK